MNVDRSQGLGARERKVLLTLILFSISMVVVPIFSYFMMKATIFEGMLGYENGSNMAAIGTVIIVHILVGIYIWIAINEDRQVAIEVADKKKE